MDVAIVIVEQLDEDGTLRTFRMQADYGEHLTIAFADEYEEARSGPFHFLDDRHETAFGHAFAECKVRKVGSVRFSRVNERFSFLTSWTGIPTATRRLSYYALSLPEFAVPTAVKFFDPRSGREYRKYVVRDDHRRRFVLYLECRSSHGSFDFVLDVKFQLACATFAQASFEDETASPYGAHIDAYEYRLSPEQQITVQQFFAKEVKMGDQYNIKGQGGVIGPNAKVENISFQQSNAEIDLPALLPELAALRSAMSKEASDSSHYKAIADVAAAETAAKKNRGAVIENLKSAGKWALDVATKLGTSVAAKAIETALGL